jgi:hypothetical protein
MKQNVSVPTRERAIQGYWRVFGGIWGLLRSTYFWVAVLLTATLQKMWMAADAGGLPRWPSVTLLIAPALLGFALGGMAITLAFSSGKFLEAIRQKGKDDSYLRKLMASFFHFCGVLSLAIVTAFVSEFYSNTYLSAFGVFVSLYGVLLVMATASRIWQTARIFNAVSDQAEPSASSQPDPTSTAPREGAQ